ncbi:MAG: hypothetical protein ACYDER_11110 [Ktedonobacteraceae bacterium]
MSNVFVLDTTRQPLNPVRPGYALLPMSEKPVVGKTNEPTGMDISRGLRRHPAAIPSRTEGAEFLDRAPMASNRLNR